MEQSISSLSYKGSIVEAISEAKRQKKLFVVYTSGDNPESKLLETSTWIQPTVSEALAKYCILLHIFEGSSEARNFSEIYPQHSAPCITVVGFNGVQLWQKEGFVAADVLTSSLEKAWLSLHFQETTAAFLTAALASGKQMTSETSGTSLDGQASTVIHPSVPLTDDQAKSLDVGQSVHSKAMEDSYAESSKAMDSKQEEVAFPEPSPVIASDDGGRDDCTSMTETGKKLGHPVDEGQNNPEVSLATPYNLGSSNEVSQEIAKSASEKAPANTEEATAVERPDDSDSSATKSTDVFLNIRLPNGSSLQTQFSLMDNLRTVKDFIHKNQTSSFRSFSIAIPYPRKIFNDQDFDKTLSELGLFNRQALIVVPEAASSSQPRAGSPHHQNYPTNDTDSLNASEGYSSYWASLRRILSYVNPLSYVTRNSNSPSPSQESQRGTWQYSANPSLQNTLRDRSRSPPVSSPGPSQDSRNSNTKRLPSQFGGNVHTLKHDDDNDRFNDRNAFWNGNSTQYGGSGNDDGK